MNPNDPEITLYHNPACSKSRQALALIRDRNPTVIEYLKTPPTPEQLGRILDLLGLQPRELMRPWEPPYTDHNLGDERLSREALIQAMVKYPVLIERPIIVANNTARIGRPPEVVLEII